MKPRPNKDRHLFRCIPFSRKSRGNSPQPTEHRITDDTDGSTPHIPRNERVSLFVPSKVAESDIHKPQSPVDLETELSGDGSASPRIGLFSGRRARAESEFQNAFAKLKRVLSEEAVVPQAIVLWDVFQIDDVEETAQKLEQAIEQLIKSRAECSKISSGVKACIINWFNVSFPFVQNTLTVLGVINPFTHFLTFFQEVIPSPYGLVATALLCLLQVFSSA